MELVWKVCLTADLRHGCWWQKYFIFHQLLNKTKLKENEDVVMKKKSFYSVLDIFAIKKYDYCD